jgi:phage shock protein E
MKATQRIVARLPSLLLASVAGLAAACGSAEQSPVAAPAASSSKDPAAARRAMAAGAVVIDVRTSEEYAEAHLPGAINLPVQELPTRLGEVGALVSGDRTRPIVVYCGSGARAAKAKAQLEAEGYSSVVNGGGLHDLQDAP